MKSSAASKFIIPSSLKERSKEQQLQQQKPPPEIPPERSKKDPPINQETFPDSDPEQVEGDLPSRSPCLLSIPKIDSIPLASLPSGQDTQKRKFRKTPLPSRQNQKKKKKRTAGETQTENSLPVPPPAAAEAPPPPPPLVEKSTTVVEAEAESDLPWQGYFLSIMGVEVWMRVLPDFKFVNQNFSLYWTELYGIMSYYCIDERLVTRLALDHLDNLTIQPDWIKWEKELHHPDRLTHLPLALLARLLMGAVVVHDDTLLDRAHELGLVLPFLPLLQAVAIQRFRFEALDTWISKHPELIPLRQHPLTAYAAAYQGHMESLFKFSLFSEPATQTSYDHLVTPEQIETWFSFLPSAEVLSLSAASSATATSTSAASSFPKFRAISFALWFWIAALAGAAAAGRVDLFRHLLMRYPPQYPPLPDSLWNWPLLAASYFRQIDLMRYCLYRRASRLDLALHYFSSVPSSHHLQFQKELVTLQHMLDVTTRNLLSSLEPSHLKLLGFTSHHLIHLHHTLIRQVHCELLCSYFWHSPSFSVFSDETVFLPWSPSVFSPAGMIDLADLSLVVPSASSSPGHFSNASASECSAAAYGGVYISHYP